MLDGYPKMPEEERKKYIHIALEKSNRLGELINEFFDITRYNLQNIELESVKINLTMMLEQIADELYGVLQEKKLTCDVYESHFYFPLHFLPVHFPTAVSQ